VRERLGCRRERRSTAGRSAMHAQVSWPELGDNPIGGVHLSAGGREGEYTLSGGGVVGPRADSLAGPNGSPRPLYYIFLFFYFSFSVLLFLL
jgi:hypothetical protein